MSEQPPQGPTEPGPEVEPQGTAPASPPLPLEDSGRPLLAGLVETLKLVIVDPKQAFLRMSPESHFGRALLYAVLLGWTGAFFGLVWQMLFGQAMTSLMPAEFQEQFGMPMAAGGILEFVFWLILSPVLTLIWLFVIGAVAHVFLMLFGGANRGFITTVKVMCFVETGQLAQIVPILGGLVWLIWGVALAIVGIAEAHNTTLGKAAGAVLAPLLLCCLCCLLGLIAFVMTGAAAAMLHQ